MNEEAKKAAIETVYGDTTPAYQRFRLLTPSIDLKNNMMVRNTLMQAVEKECPQLFFSGRTPGFGDIETSHGEFQGKQCLLLRVRNGSSLLIDPTIANLPFVLHEVGDGTGNHQKNLKF